MKSRVHPKNKTKYHVGNWPAYDRALVQRGDIPVWLSSEAIAAWTPRRSGRRGETVFFTILIKNDLPFWTLYGCTRCPARSEIPTI